MRSFREITIEEIKKAVQNSRNFTDVMRQIGYGVNGVRKSGYAHSKVQNFIRENNIDTNHFLGSGSNCGGFYRSGDHMKTDEEILVKGNMRGRTPQLRRALNNLGVPYKCKTCGQGAIWMGKPMVLQIDHMDGDRTNGVATNLCWRCPNCHSQTENYSITFGLKRIINRYNKNTSGIMFALVMAKQNNEISKEEYDELLNSYQKPVPNRRKTGNGMKRTDQEVRDIRMKFANGSNRSQLAREYETDRGSIISIITMKTYKDVK